GRLRRRRARSSRRGARQLSLDRGGPAVRRGRVPESERCPVAGRALEPWSTGGTGADGTGPVWAPARSGRPRGRAGGGARRLERARSLGGAQRRGRRGRAIFAFAGEGIRGTRARALRASWGAGRSGSAARSVASAAGG